MQASSNAYSASLEPSPRARAAVFSAGLALTAAGWLPILTLPWPATARAGLGVLWTLFGGVECLRGRRAVRMVSGYVLNADEGLVLRVAGGEVLDAEVLPGTLVLGRAIWLRFRDSRGRIGAELIPGNPRRQRDFRRALVLLRLAAGRPDR